MPPVFLRPLTTLKFIAICNGKEYVHEEELNRALSESDWKELSKLFNTATKALIKLPKDNALTVDKDED